MDIYRLKGFLMVIAAASLWGLSGTVAQSLFQMRHISVEWLVTIRLIVSGVMLLFLAGLPKAQKIFHIWKEGKGRLQFLIFGLIGMLGVQYTYFASIETGNAAVATLLQYLAPVFIIVYYLARKRVLPSLIEITAVLLALSGTFLLLTDGAFSRLAVSVPSVIWGILSAFTLAFYTLYATVLLKKYESAIVVGWGMVIGGCFMSILHPPWKLPGIDWSFSDLMYISFVVVFGTLLAFFLYLESLKYISAKETSLLGCTEPLVAVAASVLWLHVPFGSFQLVGTFLIIGMVILLSFQKQGRAREEGERFSM